MGLGPAVEYGCCSLPQVATLFQVQLASLAACQQWHSELSFALVPATLTPRRATSKSPLGQKHRPPAAGKENGGPANSGGAAALGFTPRTAEPAAPQPVALSAWKQQQLAALSAGFHSRQRRLLELLSACNRVQALLADQPAAAGPASAPAASAAPARPADSKAPSGGKAARSRAAASVAAAKPPLGPRAAAAGVGQVVGRLREQQAV